MKSQATHPARTVLRRAVSATLAIAALGAAGSASAFDFRLRDGAIEGSLDTTLSYGQAWRVQTPDRRLIATANGGYAPTTSSGGVSRSPNIDDGNLNYLAGDIYSKALKGTMELSLKWGDYGAFVRGAALYDLEVMDGTTRRTPIDDFAKNQVGSYARLLDAFVYGSWTLGEDKPLDVRVGRQVINWGESTFIQGGLTAINRIDVAALRVPGSEVKEAFLPQQMIKASLGLTENLSTEAFYMWTWSPTEPEPVGSYFASSDLVARGGTRALLGFGGYSDLGVDFRPLGGPFIADFANVPRGPTIDAKDDGQYGIAFRYFANWLGSGTELGFYFMNYHSRVPLLSGRTGPQSGVGNAAGAAVSTSAAAQALAAGLPFAAAVETGAQAGLARATAAGGNIPIATLRQYATVGANTSLARGDVAGQAGRLAQYEYAKTANYFTEYPEDLKVFGVSFNTQLGTSGIALQGEVTYRPDAPLQFDDVELLFAALTPLEAGLFPITRPGQPFPTTCTPAAPTVTRCNQLGAFGVNQYVQGWGEYDVWQAQFTATKAFPPMLGASQLIFLVEAGVTSIPDLTDKTSGGPVGRGLRFNAAGTNVSGNNELAGSHCPELPAAQCAALGLVEPQDAFADDLSWGYRVVTRLDYPSLIGPWNISPRFTWQQDVKGTTPGPGGNFIEGRYGYTLGVNANLQNRWELDASWTAFGGGNRWNDLRDRDFVAATVKFSF